MAKDRRLSTYWFVGNDDDAIQIAEWFHGNGMIGNYNYDEYLEMIRNCIIGRPKKEVLALVEWGLKQRLEATEEEPFVMALALDARAQQRGYGKYGSEVTV